MEFMAGSIPGLMLREIFAVIGLLVIVVVVNFVPQLVAKYRVLTKLLFDKIGVDGKAVLMGIISSLVYDSIKALGSLST
ncbi:hypothetical protein QNO08_03145 [Arthrobacter sp. zg-Y820]|uniref:hypothetical protein n=1 Tax=unclassified Arthrobacter TaxID=235627 RepID=UPI001E38375B|nr:MULTISPECIES: hypothetical protein [unclassified Arthrobacter]MCC9195330.1 hypothetical protein [Arthrobacter sp. zg-Y820]MDK1278189.1 hypothetical protein [Arthrobacter sp. zg.Y820]WIB10074.1 hypothetical protein QNO08_03145 [Arthrobacter sp. zg-Y820]